ncbi:ABC transporter substrate-binding protein [Candidatus Pacebacteria bacterium]|nr:ABC transporter substrate-binding protein [Candidatus Paceibacterota bacterium]
MNRIPLLIITFFITATLIFTGYVVWSQFSSETKLRSPQPSGLVMRIPTYYWPGSYWIEIADRKGWFEEAGLIVELIDANPDYYASLEDTVTGKLDVNNFYLFDLMRYRAEGVDLVVVLSQDATFGMDAVVATHDIQNVADLRGKTIGVPLGTAYEYELDVVLERNGITHTEVTEVDVPGEKAVEEFVKGTVDAVVTWEPEASAAIEQGNGKKIFDSSEIPGISPSVTGFLRSFVENRPGDVEAYVKVWNKTTKFIKENPDEAFRIIAEIYDESPDEVAGFANLDRILDLQDNRTIFAYANSFVSVHGAARKISDFLVKRGLSEKNLDSTEFIDMRFIRMLQRQ